MTRRCVLAADDDIDAAGNLLADADFFDGDDGEVDGIDGVNPVLRDIIVYENVTLADATNFMTRGTFQMNTWPNTRRLSVWGSRCGGIEATEAATRSSGPGQDTLYINGSMNMQVEAGDDWISDASYLYSSATNATCCGAVFCYSYGTRYPYKGGHMQWVRKVADAAETAADAFYTAWSTDLTGVSPGLDPKKTYIFRGIAHEAAATAKGGIAAIGQPQASAYKLVGPCWKDFGICVTIDLDDGIPVTGADGFTTRTASSTAADTPYVWLGFEEVGGPTGPSRPSGLAPRAGGFGGGGAKTGALGIFGL